MNPKTIKLSTTTARDRYHTVCHYARGVQRKYDRYYEVNSQLPNLPAKNLKRVTSYVPPNAYNVLEDWAKEEDRTVSNPVSRIVSEAVDAYLAKKTTEDEPSSN